MKWIFPVFLAVFAFFSLYIHTQNAQAATEFSFKHKLLYSVDETGKTTVTHTINLKNLTAEKYLNELTLNVNSQRISDIKSISKAGNIRVEVEKQSSGSAINLQIKDPLVGKGSNRDIVLQYTDDSVTSKLGKTWYIKIPKVQDKIVDDYTISVAVPQNFNPATSFSPKPQSTEEKDGKIVYNFTLTQLSKHDVMLQFGNEQLYNIGLSYHLKNSKSTPVYSEIALPMNTQHQTIYIESIQPKPERVEKDKDGNYLAKYTIPAKKELDIQVTAKVSLSAANQEPEVLTDQQRKEYTSKQKYWETDDPQIASIAAALKTPDKIYEYVVDTLTYSKDKLNRDDFLRVGASTALRSPENSICMEFTDLFIALSRAAGIPAREINGYAYTEDNSTRPLSLSQDILHAWPEYYDEKRGWVQVDPTWENTTNGVDYFNTFDLAHIAFVRKGINSEYPYPAGAYKTTGNNRDVLVSLTSEPPTITESFEIIAKDTNERIAGFPIQNDVVIKNTGNITLTDEIKIRTQIGTQMREISQKIDLAPYEETHLQVPQMKASFFEDAQYQLSVTRGESTKQITLHIKPFYKYLSFILGVIYLTGIPILAYISVKLLHHRKMRKI